MKKRKLTLFLTSSLTALSTLFFAAACASKSDPGRKEINKNNNPSGGNKGDGSNDKQLNEFKSKSFEQAFNLKIIDELTKKPKDKSDVTADTIKNKYREIVQIQVKPEFAKIFEANVENVYGENDRNATGKIKFIISITNKTNNKAIYKTYEVGGFKTTEMGILDNGQLPSRTEKQITSSDLDKYINLNQQQRYDQDNKAYDELVKRSWENKSINEIRPDLNYSQSAANKFNELAKKVNIPTYESAAYKGYTLPKLKENGEFDGLTLYPWDKYAATPNFMSDIDYLGGRDRYKSTGLARMLPNEMYKKIALETFSVEFNWKDEFTKEIGEIDADIKNINEWKASKNKPKFDEYIQQFVDKKLEEIKELNAEKERMVHRAHNLDKQATGEKYDRQIAEVQKKIDELKALDYDKALEILNKEKNNYEIERKKPWNERKKSRRSFGTMWIMDYVLPENGKYPTKWYFGTNSHVAKLMKEPSLNAMSLTFINNKNVGIMSKFRITGMDNNFTRFSWAGEQMKESVDTVFDAIDYLKTSPTQYLSAGDKAKFNGVEEMIDFAVIEVDFEKLVKYNSGSWSNSQTPAFPTNAEELAKLVTNDYYHRDDKDKVKFLAKSYLNNYQAIDLKLKGSQPENIDQLFAVGYPSSKDDYFLKKYTDDDQISQKELWQSLWVNSDYRFYEADPVQEGGKPPFPESRLKNGNSLSYQIGLRSFTDKPGINDAFIVAPIRGRELYETYKDDESSNNKKTLAKYFNTGLQYMLRHYTPIGGSSGSSVRNQKNEVIGVHSTIFQRAGVDFVAALRSEGYNYQGAFGAYNLPQYDLIYGGGKDQKNSYLDSLIKKYKDKDIKTWLFKNGASKDNVPVEFKFNNSGSNRS
ncbi:Membrane-associated lipoprotein precursor [Mycoplasmopsis bovigenitalium]|uniref:Membrane-associated lipoprotein n=1 Tax=Mycoplasmopsis bovigenitalium TaxID=2112 RepID=A0A449AA09_9BACT|nr:DUF31 family protein [Mycoplasmopsis bovigenitalium]VEU61044.1 Membrane-associated lipoprotein precursor [Mycoplasmopsis bovigenitalium]